MVRAHAFSIGCKHPSEETKNSGYKESLNDFISQTIALHLCIENLSTQFFKLLLNDKNAYQIYNQKHIIYIS